jgi:hypothetical protein
MLKNLRVRVGNTTFNRARVRGACPGGGWGSSSPTGQLGISKWSTHARYTRIVTHARLQMQTGVTDVPGSEVP